MVMIVCPNCNHQNPDGAVQCEACYTPLPALVNCPSCGASVQSDASFCGQCGFNLKSASPSPVASDTSQPASVDLEATVPSVDAEDEMAIPDLVQPDPLIAPEPISSAASEAAGSSGQGATVESAATVGISAPVEQSAITEKSQDSNRANVTAGSTRLQINQAKLLHVQTNTLIELPPHLNIMHLGKPNDRIPPTIDVSGFPNSEIVSRVHADIRVEGDMYYIEDVGSSNGTYINNMPLPPGNRHRLRAGDRLALGKGDKVTFIFQSS